MHKIANKFPLSAQNMANIFGGILINSTILTDYGVKMNRRGCKCRFCVHLQLASRGRIFI